MRRTPTLLFASALLLAACGGSDESTEADEPPASEEAADEDEPAGDEGQDDASGGDGNDDDATDDGTGDDESDAEGEPEESGNSEKPAVDVPGEAPTELVRTVLIEGDGEPAAAGDTVIVDYVGVRSLDGVEFDNSYDRGEPFPVALGSGGVIQGWEQGLEGAMSGERVQLDIPSDLAYGPTARSDIIRENEPLTFVIDVRTVVKVPDASDAPDGPGVELSTGEGVSETIFTDLTEGDGATLEDGDTAIIHFAYYRGDNGVLLESSWGAQTLTIPYDSVGLLPGLFDGMAGMQVGGRRAITVPPDDAFGPEGNPQAGLPAGSDVIFVVDLLAAY